MSQYLTRIITKHQFVSTIPVHFTNILFRTSCIIFLIFLKIIYSHIYVHGGVYIHLHTIQSITRLTITFSSTWRSSSAKMKIDCLFPAPNLEEFNRIFPIKPCNLSWQRHVDMADEYKCSLALV